MEPTHVERWYTNEFDRYSPETAIFVQDIKYLVENMRRDSEPINLDKYDYDDPMRHFLQHQSHFTNTVLQKLQEANLNYLRLQRTRETDNIHDLFNKLTQEGGKWFKYLLSFATFVFTNYPDEIALIIFSLLLPGETIEHFTNSLYFADFAFIKHSKHYKKEFYRYPAPAGVFRYLHAACFDQAWNCLDHNGYFSELLTQSSLVAFHWLSD